MGLANRHMKRWWILPYSEKYELKQQWDSKLYSSNWQKLKSLPTPAVCEHVEKKEFSYFADKSVNGYSLNEQYDSYW